MRLGDSHSVEGIEERLSELKQELIEKVNKRQNYDDIADEIHKLRELKQQTEIDTGARQAQLKRIYELKEYLDELQPSLSDFDEQLIRRLIKGITVYDDYFTVEFKSGASIDIKG